MANIKYKDNGEYKDIVVKVGDTLPIGTEVDYEGATAPAGWEQVDGYTETYTDLFTTTDGTLTNITLSESKTNFDYIEIQARNSDRRYESKIIPSDKVYSQFISDNWYNGVLYQKVCELQFTDNTTLVFVNNFQMAFSTTDNSITKTDGNYWYVTKIRGIKEV